MGEQAPFRFWFERDPPKIYSRLLDGVAVVLRDENSARNRLDSIVHADAIIASARVRYDGDLMDRAPGLRVISRTGIGMDNVSLPDATSRGIAVCNVPGGPTVSTAEHTVALMLAVAKQLSAGARALREGQGDFFNDYDGIELDGLRLGLIGFGKIASRVADIGKCLGMRVAAYDPFVDKAKVEAQDVDYLDDLGTLLACSDVVSLHVPLTDSTREILNEARIAQVKRGAIILNTARGGLIDERALLQALESGRVRGAGLDVFDPEPPDPTSELLWRDDVVASPHIAGATGASKDRLWRIAIEQALQVLRGERPPHLANPLPEGAIRPGRL